MFTRPAGGPGESGIAADSYGRVVVDVLQVCPGSAAGKEPTSWQQLTRR